MRISWPFGSHRHWTRMANEFVDGQLDVRDAGRFEGHLASCPSCQELVDDLRHLKASVAAMPEAAPSRSFRLTPAMVEGPVANPRAQGQPWALWAVQGVAVVALIGFFTMLTIDLAAPTGRQPAGTSQAAPALVPLPASQPTSAKRFAAPNSAATAPAKGVASPLPAGVGAAVAAPTEASAPAPPVPQRGKVPQAASPGAPGTAPAPAEQAPSLATPARPQAPATGAPSNGGRSVAFHVAEFALLGFAGAAAVIAVFLSLRSRRF